MKVYNTDGKEMKSRILDSEFSNAFKKIVYGLTSFLVVVSAGDLFRMVSSVINDMEEHNIKISQIMEKNGFLIISAENNDGKKITIKLDNQDKYRNILNKFLSKIEANDEKLFIIDGITPSGGMIVTGINHDGIYEIKENLENLRKIVLSSKTLTDKEALTNLINDIEKDLTLIEENEESGLDYGLENKDKIEVKTKELSNRIKKGFGLS